MTKNAKSDMAYLFMEEIKAMMGKVGEAAAAAVAAGETRRMEIEVEKLGMLHELKKIIGERARE